MTTKTHREKAFPLMMKLSSGERQVLSTIENRRVIPATRLSPVFYSKDEHVPFEKSQNITFYSFDH